MNRNIPEKKKYYKVEAYLDDLPLEWKERFIIVRELILATHPAIVEKISFNLPFYMYKGFFLYLGIYKQKQLVLAFCRGAHLSDEYNILKADAKQQQMRHWVLSSVEEPDYELLAFYLEEALMVNDKLNNKWGNGKKRD